VNEKIFRGETKLMPVPERRKALRTAAKAHVSTTPVWRCKVCGYLCGREHPPDICPICKAKKERFEPFLLS